MGGAAAAGLVPEQNGVSRCVRPNPDLPRPPSGKLDVPPWNMSQSNPLFTYPSYTLSGWQGPVNPAQYTQVTSTSPDADTNVPDQVQSQEHLFPHNPTMPQSHVVKPIVARSMSLSDIYMRPASSTQRRHRRRQRQDEHHISRPPNCFILFRREFVKQLNQSGAEDRGMLSSRAAQAWKGLPEHVRKEWKALADAVAADHLARNPGYHFYPRRRQTSQSPISGHASRARSLDFDACTTISESSSQADDYFNFESAEESTSAVSSPRSSRISLTSTASGSASTSASEWSTTSVDPVAIPYPTDYIVSGHQAVPGGFGASASNPNPEGIMPQLSYPPQSYHGPQSSAALPMAMPYELSQHASPEAGFGSVSTQWTLMPPPHHAHPSPITTGWMTHGQSFAPVYDNHGYTALAESSSNVTPTTPAYSSRPWDHPPAPAGFNTTVTHQSPTTDENMGL